MKKKLSPQNCKKTYELTLYILFKSLIKTDFIDIVRILLLFRSTVQEDTHDFLTRFFSKQKILNSVLCKIAAI